MDIAAFLNQVYERQIARLNNLRDNKNKTVNLLYLLTLYLTI
jgi:uncharacterized membrane protein